MKQRKWLFGLLVLALVLAGCAGGETEPSEAAPAAPEEAAVLPEDDEVPSGPVVPAECVVMPPEELVDVPVVPLVVENEYVYGNPDAAVSVIEYSELQCPYCSQFEPVVTELAEKYGDEVRIVFRHFPLSMHDKAMLGAQALEAAGNQDPAKFNELKNGLFEKQEEWTPFTVEEFEALLLEEAEVLGLDVEQFEADLTSDETIAVVENLRDGALEVGINGTPTVLIDGFMYGGPRDVESIYAMTQAVLAAKEAYGEEYIASLPHVGLAVPEDIQSLIDTYEALVAQYGEEGIKKYPLSLAGSPDIFEVIIKYVDLKDSAYTQCPEMTIDRSKQYFATLETTQGEVVIELYPDKAPTTVNSFVFLANEGWFDNIDFHRVIPGFVAQTGDPSGTGLGSPGYAFGNEANDLLYDGPGVVGMANSGPDTNGSQFFISYDSLPQLDGGYTIFGKVVEGMDNLVKLTAIDPQQGTVAEPDQLLSVTIEEK
ncbi:MAG: peptidylprolyl isomerase [Anaerolineaceae bacterium]|jgi:cyclophilin family peptidyl-prolyl cis-trans isomerase/protein-disulfide isomerase|nr:peptidylprolyl isomerase [Anaerolineaceae bacterium]